MTKEEKTEEEKTDAGSSNATNTKPLEWTPENEYIMIEWCDVAQCYKWLNTRAHQKYSQQHAWFTIPTIVLSTVTGTASFAQTSLPLNYQPYAPMVIGTINICIGVLTTIQQYLKISELNESHRVAAIAWDKFARNIKIELAKSPLERIECGHFLKHSRQEYDRLMETSPSIEPDILKRFEKTFARVFKDGFEKPEICNSLISVKTIIYKKSEEEKKEKIFKELVGDIMMVQTENQDSKDKLIKEFYQRFEEELHRPPTKQEIMDNLMQDELSITEEQIDEYLVGVNPYNPNGENR
jgi:hypothetical protein